MNSCASGLVLAGVAGALAAAGADQVRTVAVVQPETPGGLYVANRAPLAPSPFLKLPIGAITPKGWLRHMLELKRDGMVGRLAQISPWLDFAKSSWADKEGRGKFGWEEMPYWLKGYGDLGYVLKDEILIATARKWIDAAMASQRADGFFGPRELLTSLKGKPDLWPHMVMLNILQSHHEFSGEPRVLELMERYFRWEHTLPATAFGEGYWPRIRAGDNLESIYWLYNRLETGDRAWLLDLARKIHENMAAWHREIVNWHNVNLAQGFRAGTVYGMQERTPALLASAERNYTRLMGVYGQFPGGGFVGDENCRPGHVDPRGGIETCGIVEFMHSFEMLTKITGNPVWSDRNEEIAFNSFPASMTPDLKGLHYITCANQVQLDRDNKSPGIQNGGTMFSYSPFAVYRCCQHNVSHGWPYYAEELWLATHDRGLCASLYAASDVSAKVGDGTTVKILEQTDYPFGETVTLKVLAPKAVTFPLYLRIPGWCRAAALTLNGAPLALPAPPTPRSYLVLERAWIDGDTVTLHLPMQVAVRTWPANKNAVSVDRGPLSFSLAIQERWQRYGDNPQWPEWEVFPASDWNYGLLLDAANPSGSFTLERRPGPLPAQPFTPDTAPLRLRVKARKIPGWQTDRLNMVGPLQPSPAKTDQPVDTVTLIPMGAARLRIASFPTVSADGEGHQWVAAAKPKPSVYRASASHCNPGDTVEALGDGLEPSRSNDTAIPRFTWWPHRGTREWAQFDFTSPITVSQVALYWFDDTGAGQCRVPDSWALLARSGSAWKPVSARGAFGTARDAWNTVEFAPVETTALRLTVELQPGFSGGILEWKVAR
ncbi:MAG: glycoside hydrolase family 127 protein [Verrucomicrobia bacterium]|nr:glycoside hydrolase family 127 protein [Verrucomicrobiota bacterium]